MTGLTAAIKNDPARHALQAILEEIERQGPMLVEVPETPNPFSLGFKVGLAMQMHFKPPPGQPYAIELTSDGPHGTIKATLRADIAVKYLAFDFDVNRVWGSGWLKFVCIKRFLGVCVAGFPIIMPHIGVQRFTLDVASLGIPPIPLTSVDVAFSVINIELGDRIDDDHRNLMAKLVILGTGVFDNEPAFMQTVIRYLYDRIIRDRLAQIPGLGLILIHVADFIEKIVNWILDRAKFADYFWHFVVSDIQNRLAALLGPFFDPSIKVGKFRSRMMIAHEVTAPSGQKQPPLYANFETLVVDVNKDCAAPELRGRVVIN